MALSADRITLSTILEYDHRHFSSPRLGCRVRALVFFQVLAGAATALPVTKLRTATGEPVQLFFVARPRRSEGRSAAMS